VPPAEVGRDPSPTRRRAAAKSSPRPTVATARTSAVRHQGNPMRPWAISWGKRSRWQPLNVAGPVDHRGLSHSTARDLRGHSRQEIPSSISLSPQRTLYFRIGSGESPARGSKNVSNKSHNHTSTPESHSGRGNAHSQPYRLATPAAPASRPRPPLVPSRSTPHPRRTRWPRLPDKWANSFHVRVEGEEPPTQVIPVANAAALPSLPDCGFFTTVPAGPHPQPLDGSRPFCGSPPFFDNRPPGWRRFDAPLPLPPPTC